MLSQTCMDGMPSGGLWACPERVLMCLRGKSLITAAPGSVQQVNLRKTKGGTHKSPASETKARFLNCNMQIAYSANEVLLQTRSLPVRPVSGLEVRAAGETQTKVATGFLSNRTIVDCHFNISRCTLQLISLY